jgi:hypothetical protein
MLANRIGEGERTQANTREHKLFAMFANVRLGFSPVLQNLPERVIFRHEDGC